MASPEEPDGVELQVALNDNPATQACQEAVFYSYDTKSDYERREARGAEFTVATTQVRPGTTILVLNDTCSNLFQVTQQGLEKGRRLAEWLSCRRWRQDTSENEVSRFTRTRRAGSSPGVQRVG